MHLVGEEEAGLETGVQGIFGEAGIARGEQKGNEGGPRVELGLARGFEYVAALV